MSLQPVELRGGSIWLGSSCAFPVDLDVFLAFGQSPRKILREMSVKTASLLEGCLSGYGPQMLPEAALGSCDGGPRGSVSMLSTVLGSHCGRQSYVSPPPRLQCLTVSLLEGERVVKAGPGGRCRTVGGGVGNGVCLVCTSAVAGHVLCAPR